MRRRVDVEIDRLVLRGFFLSNQSQIGKAVERELGKLCAEQEPRLTNHSSEIPNIEGGAINIKTDEKSENIGMQIARKVHEGMSR